jgi:hypothetical protein
MQVNKIIAALMLIDLFLKGCIEPFHPELDDAQHSIVIEGTLTDKEGYCYIHVSRSVPHNSSENNPVQDCDVGITDNSGNTINFYESEPGLYEQWIGQEFLKTGKKYKLRVTLADKIYESRYETLLPCPPIGNVYYEIEKRGTTDPDYDIYGIQFYTDLVVPKGYPENYRWELDETWEYRSVFPLQLYWNGKDMISLPFPSDSIFFCWNSGPIYEIFTSSLKNITANSLSRIPLNYVSNETNRLTVRYSFLVKQYSMSDTTYDYWNQLQKLSQETGGLYETQPPQIRGNIVNINDVNEVVLGNFNVSGISEKRLFVSEKFNFFPDCHCCIPYVPAFGILFGSLPVYFVGYEGAIVNRECVDCTLLGGTTQKPDFWE